LCICAQSIALLLFCNQSDSGKHLTLHYSPASPLQFRFNNPIASRQLNQKSLNTRDKMICSTARMSTVSALYTLSCTLAVAPLLLVLSATAYVFYGALPGVCVLTAGLVSVVGFVLHCLMSAKRQLENATLPAGSSAGEKIPARSAGFQGCTGRPEKSGYWDNNEAPMRLL